MNLNLLDQLTDGVTVEDEHGVRATVGELRAFNAALLAEVSSQEPPLAAGPAVYTEKRKEYPAIIELLANGLVTLREPDFVSPVDPARSSDTVLGELEAIIARGSGSAFAEFLDRQISVRRQDLIALQRMLYIHQTACQNAVDAVQTKRIDFLGVKKETWADGLVGSLFFAVLFAAFPIEALFVRCLSAMLRRAVRVVGPKVLSRMHRGATGALKQQLNELVSKIVTLHEFSNANFKQREKLRRNKKHPVVQAAQGLKLDNSLLSREGIREAAQKLQDELNPLMAQHRQAVENEKELFDFLVHSAGELAEKAPIKAIPTVLAGRVQTTVQAGDQSAKAASALLPEIGAPIDVAFKLQVQTLYSSLVFYAEDVVIALEAFREACRYTAPGEAELKALLPLLVQDLGFEVLEIPSVEVPHYLADATDAYEQLLWVLVFGPHTMLTQKNVTTSLDSPLPKDAPDFINVANPEFESLFAYLKARFYPALHADDIAINMHALYLALPIMTPGATGPLPPSGEPLPKVDLAWERFANPTDIQSLLSTVKLKRVDHP